MHKLDQLVAQWRRELTATPDVGSETLDELEIHLREATEQFLGTGMTETEAFRAAVTQLGFPHTIASEFRKLSQPVWWPVKVAIGFASLVAIAPALLLAMHFDERGSRLLLMSHVFAVMLGFVITFLLGALGICYVCQRCFAEFSSQQLQSLRRTSFVFYALATTLTAVGIFLGALWAKAEWGRYWAWDPKETGAFCVLVWLLLLTAAHGWQRMTVRVLLLLSIVGNILVTLAWFGANMVGGPQASGTSAYSFLMVAIALNVMFVLAGFAPAGCLRLRKA